MLKLLEEDVRILNSHLAAEQAHKQELDSTQELSWNTYQNLATKAAELGVSVENIGTELTFATPASVPIKPASTDNRMILFGSAVGFIVGVLIAYGIEFWWGYQGIKPQPITITYIIRETKKYISSRSKKLPN